MKSAVCTLFEGDYYYGVGALVNSLYAAGFRGCVWAGYKGSLPPWAKVDEHGAMAVATGLQIRFILVTTDWHLTNYKPSFMSEIWNREGSVWDSLFYFDPDIVITCPWSFYENWAASGICLVQEITNSNMPDNHPIRLEWGRFLNVNQRVVKRSMNQYFNGGFIGLNRESVDFLKLWHEVLVELFSHTKKSPSVSMNGWRWDPFLAIDQDALNISCMASDYPLSTIGPEGMGLTSGGFTMQHAVGSPKPWRYNLANLILQGVPPSSQVKAYWFNVKSPINLYAKKAIVVKRLVIKFAAFVGRFYGQR